MRRKRVALVDYGAFTRQKEEYGSILELMDILIGKQFEVYALFPKDTKQEMPLMTVDIKDIICYTSEDFLDFNLVKETMDITKCDDFHQIYVISTHPELLTYFKKNHCEVCRIYNGYNDVLSSNMSEVNHVKQFRKILK